jgi:uncharacterized protein involved in oxidation of intracellular sulfur
VNYLFILNDPAYGTERSYNALRLAGSLARDTEHEVKVFLIGEGATCAHRARCRRLSLEMESS